MSILDKGSSFINLEIHLIPYPFCSSSFKFFNNIFLSDFDRLAPDLEEKLPFCKIPRVSPRILPVIPKRANFIFIG